MDHCLCVLSILATTYNCLIVLVVEMCGTNNSIGVDIVLIVDRSALTGL